MQRASSCKGFKCSRFLGVCVCVWVGGGDVCVYNATRDQGENPTDLCVSLCVCVSHP